MRSAFFIVRCALTVLCAQSWLYALNPLEKPVDYVTSQWTTEAGLPHNSVRAILQTRDGYLWLATNYGLTRFDGLTFTIFNKNNTPAIAHSQITSLAETRDGSLWFGTAENLVRYHDGKFTAYTEADGLKSKTINAVCVAPDGSLWIGGQQGVTRWVDGKFVNDIDTSRFQTIGLRSITMDRQNTMWIASGAEVLRYKNGGFTRFGREHGLIAERVQRISEDHLGRTLVVTQSGLFRIEGDRVIPFEHNAKLGSLLDTTAIADHAGNIWIGSVAGLDRYYNDVVTPYLDRFGHKLGTADAIYEDREGCLWVGTAEGLYRFTDRRARSLTTEDGLSANLVSAVRETSDGSLWVGTWGSGIDRFRNGTVSHYRIHAPLSHETITRIYEAPDGTIWLGTRNSSVDRIEGDKATTYVYVPGTNTSRPVLDLLTDDDGTLLITIDKRGLLELRDGKITPVPEVAAWAATMVSVWNLHRTLDGRLLAGTNRGVYERRPDRSWHLLKIPGLEDTVNVRDFLEEGDGTFWLATDGHGLVRWRNGSTQAYGVREGMVDDLLFSLLDDGEGSLWVCSARGIGRIRKEQFADLARHPGSALNCMTFGRVDGLTSASSPGSGSPLAWQRSDGSLVFATDQGVAVIDPATLQANPQPPTVVIESVAADAVPQALSARTILPAGTSKLEVRYTALSLIAPQRLRFRYQLVGSDSGWVEAGHERSARYTHLAPGAYTFRVIASNNDGVWNETGASLALFVEPHFYETLWFRFAAGFVVLATVAGAVGLRLRQLKLREDALARTNAELDQRVRERTAELSRSHAEIQQRELLFRLIFEHAPVGISWSRADLDGKYHFNSAFRRILDLPADTLPDNSLLSQLAHPEDAPRQAGMEALIRSGTTDSYTIEQRFVLKDGRLVFGLLAVAVVRDASGNVTQVISLLEDISALKRAEQELANTYKRLMEASRMAGMAEVATGVLHNVGNVLNSVNVSATVLADGLRQSRLGGVARISGLLHEHAADLGTFLTNDPKGQRVLPYLDTLADHLTGEQQRFLVEVESLRRNVEHIKEVVARQQSFAQLGGLLEKLAPVELFEDALRMNAVALHRHNVELVRDFQPTPLVMAERHKVLQILINLIQNAKQAMSVPGAGGKRLLLRIVPQERSVQFVVSDDGVGIDAQNITRIFEHGFTTKTGGHGFGLHASANSAREMKGSLTVQSDGPGRGATFTLELPIAPAAQPPTATNTNRPPVAPAKNS